MVSLSLHLRTDMILLKNHNIVKTTEPRLTDRRDQSLFLRSLDILILHYEDQEVFHSARQNHHKERGSCTSQTCDWEGLQCHNFYISALW